MKHTMNDKVIIITGSSMGIGKSLAKLLGGKHAKLVINGRSEERLLATEVELKKRGYEVISIVADISNEAGCRYLVDATVQQFGRIDILVNNAGVSMRGTLEELSPKVISTVFAINTIAPAVLSRMVLPHMRQSKGSIVFISSLAGLHGLPLIGVYCAAKMALTAMVESLQIECQPHGIHVGLVYVGYTENEQGKTTIGASGLPIPLQERKGFFTATRNQVAEKIYLNIVARQRRTTIGIPGKLYAKLVRYFPLVVGRIIQSTYRKKGNLYD